MHDESSCDVAFTPAVKAIQERRGSRVAYAKYVFSVIGRLVVKFLQVFIFCWLPANGVR